MVAHSKCSVPYCWHRKDKNPGCLYATFLKDVDRCRLWVKKVGVEDLVLVPMVKLTKIRFVCGCHFEDSQFSNHKRKRLNRTAVPTEFDPRLVPLSDVSLIGFPLALEHKSLWRYTVSVDQQSGSEENTLAVTDTVETMEPPTAAATYTVACNDTDPRDPQFGRLSLRIGTEDYRSKKLNASCRYRLLPYSRICRTGLEHENCVSHPSNENCLPLGHKLGRVLGAGSDDEKAVGKENCVMSFRGHTTSVKSVRFGRIEDPVRAGSQMGELKIKRAKLTKTLTGHKAGIRCMVFYPYGDLLTSGSVDTAMKLWDIRRKGCISTYPGHNQAVNTLKFIPDGQWFVSAEESTVKIHSTKSSKDRFHFESSRFYTSSHRISRGRSSTTSLDKSRESTPSIRMIVNR